MPTLLIFGFGYTAARLAQFLAPQGWEILSTGARGSMAFHDAASVILALDRATHILSSVPPMADGDPVLAAYGPQLAQCGAWLGYLSSTGVYGDAGGGWVDETAPIRGRRANRNEADVGWLDRGARVFRLPGIYGPGRSILDRVRAGQAHRIDLPDQVFSRVHVDDIVAGIVAGFDGQPGAYNLADDYPCSQNLLVEEACRLLGQPLPPLLPLDDAGLTPMARAFYSENRRVANGKARRKLRWTPKYSDFRSGLRELWMNERIV